MVDWSGNTLVDTIAALHNDNIIIILDLRIFCGWRIHGSFDPKSFQIRYSTALRLE